VPDLLERLKNALADRYQLDRELGAGGMATVYLATDVRHARQVAVKVLRPELSATLGPDRFLQEIRIAANLQHPHILAVHDSGDAQGFLYYVMPYIEGPSLREKLAKHGELPVAEAVRILRDVADGLAAAHARGVVHRDIKPENVLLSGRHALVADFGVAKAVSEATGRQSLTTAGVALGTPTYMAPEQAAADPHVDHRADLYAFGVMAYEALTGRPPFQGGTPQQVLAAHITEAPVAVTIRRTNLAPALAGLVMRCLEKKPADRPQSADEVLAVLESVATPSGGTTPTLAAPVASVPRHAWARWAAVAGGVALAGLAIFAGERAWSGARAGAQGAKTGKALAVVPFDNETGDTANAYLGSGLAEDLVTALGRVPGLEVKSPSAARRALAREGATLASVGALLGADYIVEGSLRRAGTGWRVTARLVRPADEVQVWSESFDRPEKELLNLAPDIATRLSMSLVGQLGADTRAAMAERPTTNADAYEAYLRGNFDAAQRTRDKLQMALTEYQHALALDPSLNAARARLGFVLSLKADFRWFLPGETFHATIARGLAAVDSALASDSSLADGWFARCSLLWEDYGYGGHRMNQARSACERAVALAPTKAEIQNRMGFVLYEFNDLQGATAHARLALRADPEWHLPHWLLAYVAMDAGDLRGAMAQWDSVERTSPPSSYQWTYTPVLRGRARLAQGDTAGARELLVLCRQRGCAEPGTMLEGLLWGRRGRADSAEAIATRIEQGLVPEVSKEDPYSQFDAALIRLAAGDTARAFQTLRRRVWRVTDLLVPELAGLRRDPRYQALLGAAWQRIRTDAP